MTEKQEALEVHEVRDLANELTYHRYLMNKGQMLGLFHKMNVGEYLALHHIDIASDRTYLKELAKKMQLPIQQASGIVSGLEDRGLLIWSHDGNGSEGTYMTITESGQKLIRDQEKLLREYYGHVFAKFGRQNLIQLLSLMKQLEDIMGSEFEEK